MSHNQCFYEHCLVFLEHNSNSDYFKQHFLFGISILLGFSFRSQIFHRFLCILCWFCNHFVNLLFQFSFYNDILYIYTCNRFYKKLRIANCFFIVYKAVFPYTLKKQYIWWYSFHSYFQTSFIYRQAYNIG